MLRDAFGETDGRVWLNTAFQGPLPLVAQDAARRAVDLKASPARLSEALFEEVPARLRRSLASLVSGEPDEIVLGNSTSYGLHLLARGLAWRPGDEVLVAEGDFPASRLPWLARERDGVVVRTVPTDGGVLEADVLRRHLTPRARVVCASWVNSFSGRVTDLGAVGAACRSAGVSFVVKRVAGCRRLRLDVRRLPIDALASCGWKWFCGPYGTGFCWVRRPLLEALQPTQRYWRSDAEGWMSAGLDGDAERRWSGQRHDVFASACFMNTMPWTAAIELIASVGMDRVESHSVGLAERLRDGLRAGPFRLVEPLRGAKRSAIVSLAAPGDVSNPAVWAELRAQGIDIAHRGAYLRCAPHVPNSESDIDRAIEALHVAAADARRAPGA